MVTKMAIEIQHTPGPWKHDHGHIFGVDKRPDRSRPEEYRIADVRGWGHLSYHGEKKAIEIQEGNARLIAAAPDLFDVVVALLIDPIDEAARKRANALVARVSRGKEPAQ